MFNLLALLLALFTPAPIPTPQSLPVTTLQAPSATLRVQVARTQEQRDVGLMGVTHLRRHTGMVFIFDTDAPIAFWMKDTLIPLDMVFVAADGTVRTVFEDVPVVPRTLPDNQIPLEQGTAKYVIELPANEARKDGLVAGVRLRGISVLESNGH